MYTGSPGHFSSRGVHRPDVVVVAVGQQDHLDFHIAALDHGDDLLRGAAGVHHGAGLGLLVPDEVAVGHQGGRFNGVKIHGSFLSSALPGRGFIRRTNCPADCCLLGLPGPGPGSIGGCAPPNPAVHFWTPKSEPKKPPKPRFWIPLSQSVFIKFGTSLPLNFVFYLIYSGSIDDTSAAALLKGDMFR